MDELKNLIEQKKKFFKDHKQQIRQKTIVALKRIVHPFSILTFCYLASLIYNIDGFYKLGDS